MSANRALLLAIFCLGVASEAPAQAIRPEDCVVRSHEPGETWAWCYIDEVDL